jgi:hypothetical protein
MFSSGLVFVVDVFDWSSKSVQMLDSTGSDGHCERVFARRRRYRKNLSAA